MKKTVICALVAMFFSASPTWAQSNNGHQDESLADKVSTIVKKAKSSMQRAGKRVEKAIGINDKNRDGDEVKIDGTYYMPIYSLNIYNGKDADKFKNTCHSPRGMGEQSRERRRKGYWLPAIHVLLRSGTRRRRRLHQCPI